MSVILNYRLLEQGQWESGRFQLLRFVRRHGERRITAHAWQKLLLISDAELAQPGTAIAVAYTQGGCPAGVAFADHYGESACLVTVHPALRGRGVGRKLLGVLAEPWGRLNCNVAIDNAPSVAMCFAAGLVAVGLETGPTGKPTLRFVRRNQEADAPQADDRPVTDDAYRQALDDGSQAMPATPNRR